MKRYVHNIPAARRLRRTETTSEEMLWERLRDRRLLGQEFRRQHAIGAFVIDFYCHEERLAVEIDGGIHLATEQRERDESREAILRGRGLRFVRIPSELVESDIEEALNKIAALLTPSPAKSGEGAGG